MVSCLSCAITAPACAIFAFFCPWSVHPCDPGTRLDRRAVLCRLRGVQRLAADAAGWREWNELLAVRAGADQRYSRAASEVPADAYHRLSDRSTDLPSAVYLRGHVPR